MFSMSKGHFVHFVLQSMQSLQVFCQSDAMDGLIEVHSPSETFLSGKQVLLCKNFKKTLVNNYFKPS